MLLLVVLCAVFAAMVLALPQVDEFILMGVEEALEGVRRSLSRWEPNCALVMIDFALRHGFLSSDDEASLVPTSLQG